MSVSIAAGFRGGELAQALGLDTAEWTINRTTSAFGVYRMIAVRRV